MATRALQYSAARTLKTVLRDYSTGVERLWYTTGNAFEAYNAAHVAAYGIATAEGTTGTYTWTVPAALPASATGYEYDAVSYDCAGASLVAGDLASPAYRSTFEWDGTKAIGLSAINEAVSSTGGIPGPGADRVTVNIKSSGVNVANAEVWVTTDAGGTHTIAGSLPTDSGGNVTFLLTDGDTYYLWMWKDGVQPILGTSFVAEAD